MLKEGLGNDASDDKELGPMDQQQRQIYWRRNLRLMAGLLTIWALVSFGAGIIFVDFLNQWEILGFPLGFWFAQQGSIITFVLLTAFYVWRMDKLDSEFGVQESDSKADNS